MRFFAFYLFLSSVLFAAPEAIYLTLPEDPAHSMSVHWIEKKKASKTLFYQKEGDGKWKEVSTFSSQSLIGSSYSVKECLLNDLKESSYYVFYFEGEKEKHLFRTLPSNLKSPLKIAIGGDFSESFALFHKMNLVAAQKNPDFAILGGDIAYACGKSLFSGKHGSVSKWIEFFKEWQNTMRGERGQLIPVAAVIGNHDVTPKDRQEKGENALFLKFFPSSNNKTYRTLDIAGSLRFVLLDSGHLFGVEEQVSWLLESLIKAKQDMQWGIPVYHIAAYPSTYRFRSKVAVQLRKQWVTLFEEYGVKLAFEHHNHAFKRTYPMLKEKVNPDGIVYIGDGCWGSSPRGSPEGFHLEKTMQSTCFSLLTVDQTSLQIETFDSKNELIDLIKIEKP